MRNYALVSGAFFSLIALVQLVRTLMRWPVQVADTTIPVWASGVAFVIAASFALWAFRTARGTT